MKREPNLIGTTTLAELFGYSGRKTVVQAIHSGAFPVPVERIGTRYYAQKAHCLAHFEQIEAEKNDELTRVLKARKALREFKAMDLLKPPQRPSRTR